MVAKKKARVRVRRGARGRLEVFGALDLSMTVDMTSLCLAWWTAERRVAVKHWFWLPEDDIDAREMETPGARYREWAEQGWLTLMPGEVIDYDRVCDDIVALTDQVRFRELSYDPFRAGVLVQRLEDAHIPCVEFPQKWDVISPAIQEVERAIRKRDVVHEDNPIMRWQMNQAKLSENTVGNVRIIKADGGKGRTAKRKYKIDGVITLVMAASRCLLAPRPRRPRAVQL